MSINRKKRTEQADYKLVKDGRMTVSKPESFLSEIFTPMQLNPVEFAQMPKQQQNRIILDLIEFNWDLNWIKEKFGEIPEGVNYQQNILQVLHQIQADDGVYFSTRQDINRDIRNKRAFIEDIAKSIPENYQAEKWENYQLGEEYKELAAIKEKNNKIQRAKAFKDSYDNKTRGYEAEKEIAISAAEKTIATEREQSLSKIERLKAEIKAEEDKLLTLSSKLDDKKAIAEEQYNTKVAQLDNDMAISNKYAGFEPVDTAKKEEEINNAEAMIKHLNEYKRLVDLSEEVELLVGTAEGLTNKIELARTLPGVILNTAKLPIDGMTVENGIPLINGLPVSNLSEGEKLDLCADVAISRPNALQIILIDGTEKLSDENRMRLYEKCKEKGLQFIATRTTNDNELEVTTL